MLIKGKYSSAEIFTDAIDHESLSQIYNLLNHPAAEGSKIAIMPDVHVGKGAVVGLTMTFGNFIIPSIIGVDIGCGISAYKIGKVDIDLEKFDVLSKTGFRQAGALRAPELFGSSRSRQNPVQKRIEKHHILRGL